MSRICESCEKIDFGKWGRLGLIGYSLIVGAFGAAIGGLFFSYELLMLGVFLGIALWLPMYYISLEETRRAKNAAVTE